jgi:hypothetical protein
VSENTIYQLSTKCLFILNHAGKFVDVLPVMDVLQNCERGSGVL